MQLLSRLIPETSEGRRQLAVLAVLVAFAMVVVIVTSIVLAAIGQVARHANDLDDGRSQETTNGALQTFVWQLKATLNDYAAWDDAAQYVYAPDQQDWVISNIGDMTVNSDLFDTAFVVGLDRKVYMAYRHGKPLEETLDSYFSPAIATLFINASAPQSRAAPEAAGFVETRDGIAAAGVSLVRMKSGELSVPVRDQRYLVYARHLNEDKVRKLSDTYVIPGLRLVGPEVMSPYFAPIIDATGKLLAKLVWTSRVPGDASFEQARPLVLVAVGIVGCFFLGLLLLGVIAMRRLKEDETRAQKLAMEDRLSGLLNRSGFYAGLEKLIRTARDEKCSVFLLYLDLDGFKEVNDAYGHGTGDQLIRGVSAGLQVLVPPDAMLARIGGDEFAVAIATRQSEEVARKLGEVVLSFFAEPLVIGERVATVGASIGIAASPLGLVDCDEALRRADLAMYKAKENGRGRIFAYDPDMDADREEKNRIEIDLRRAIENGELTVAYQPVVRAIDCAIVGVEALVRWTRAGHGPVPPDSFIPVAETTGLIDALGMFVLRTACLQILEWPDLHVAINISPGQFRNPAFTVNVADVIRQTGVDPERITLEVTEGYFIQNPARARWTIDRLKAIGVKIALDDFGAGFSSVGYLRQFGFDRMKIDRSLVAAVHDSVKARDLLQATVAMARALDIPVTAEGIEEERQALALRSCGCDEMQGFHFGRPAPAAEIAALLSERGGRVIAA
ncbi:MAG: bifunctional diguanylate cyclase/phosphodiesterase [Rhizobiales bacterium 63-7]|nr:MAG: bifunctional diguanylate cyclase/phosphodiesterase [Rhizobiales bacterium 63-7]